jgi:hypothetical protein
LNRQLLLLATLLIVARSLSQPCHAQTRKPAKGKAPETSVDASFDPEQLAKLAVIAYTEERSRQSQSDQQRLVEDIFVQTLLDRGHVVVARSDIQSVLTEQELAKSGLTDSNAVSVGKLLNVPAVLVVRITEYSTEMQRDFGKSTRTSMARATVGARLIAVETGSIWWQGSHSLSDEVTVRGELVEVLVQLTDRLARTFPEKTSAKGKRFDPSKIDKLALVMVGESRRPNRMASIGRIGGEQRTDQDRQVEDKLGIMLGKKGYALVSRSDLEAVMQEKRFQQSGLTEENVSEIGKLLNIPAVMVARITECEAEEFQKPPKKSDPRNRSLSRATMATAALGARLISVESGEVLWCRAAIDSQEVSGKLETSQVLAKVAKRIGDALPQRGGKKAP